MKCVRTNDDAGRVFRMTDEDAAWVVAQGLAHYCPKAVWKAQGRMYANAPIDKGA